MEPTTYTYETLPAEVIINGVQYTKTYNSDNTAFNFVGTNDEVKSASDVCDILNGVTQDSEEAVSDSEFAAGVNNAADEANATLNQPGHGASPIGGTEGINLPEGSSDESLDAGVQEASEPADAE